MAFVFCFTSTGNSLYTAQKIAEHIDGKVIPMNNVSLNTQTSWDDEVIGFVYPVFFWGLPRLVERYISQMRIENKNAYIFAVATYGGVVHGVNGRINELLKSKGARLSYGANLKSVENYIPSYKVKDSEEFRQKISANIAKIIDAVKNRESNRIQAYSLLNKLDYRYLPDESSDRYFTVTPSCTGCAICQNICPAANIEMTVGKPVFSGKCEHCLACLHNCPAHAVDWKNKTQGRERYRHFAITLEKMISFNMNQL